MKHQTLTIGELAKYSGTTPRTLRHFESLGLIRASRTESGHRVYDVTAVTTLSQILLLKRVGFSLTDINTMGLTPSSPKNLLATQIALLSSRVETMTRAIDQLRSTLTILEDYQNTPDSEGPIDLAAFCLLLREGTETLQRDNIKPILAQYFTPAEQSEWQHQMDKHFSAEDRTFYEMKWTRLIARCEEALSLSLPPTSPQAQNLAKEWLELQKPLQNAISPEIWKKTNTMYNEMENWHSPDRQAPFTPAVFQFIQLAAKALKQG